MDPWIGTYEKAGGAGLVPLDSPGDAMGAVRNASFAVASPATGVIYTVNEQDEGEVHAWRHQDGAWTSLGHTPSGGKAPCFLALSPDGTMLAVANYGDGRVGVIDLDRDQGHLLGLTHVMREQGNGPDPERQDGPHAHCVAFTPDGARLLHVDLGLDRIFAWPPDGSGGAECVFEAPPGSGPRHLAFLADGQRALLLTELSARLFLLEWDGTRFIQRDAKPALPEPFEGENLGGHLAVMEDGSVLVSNRGHDSVASFAVVDGRLRSMWWEKTGGSSPRHFAAGDGVLVVAHEKDGIVATLPLPGAPVTERRRRRVPGAAFVLDADAARPAPEDR